MKSLKSAFIVTLLLTLALGLAFTTTQAQTLRLEQSVRVGKVTNSVSDTSATLSIEYAAKKVPWGVTYAGLEGVLPDSVKLSWDAQGATDSIKALISLDTRQAGGAWRSAIVDSVKAEETDNYVIPYTTFKSKDEMRIRVTGQAAGNKLAGGHNSLSLRVEYYYKKP